MPISANVDDSGTPLTATSAMASADVSSKSPTSTTPNEIVCAPEVVNV